MSDVMAVDVADTAAVAKRRDAKTTVDPELFGQLVDQARLVQQPPSYWASCCRSAAVVVGSSASNEGVDGVLVEVALQCGRDVVSTADLYGPVRFEPSTYLVGRRFELRQPRRDHGIVLRSRIPVALPAHLRHDQTDWGLDQHWPRWAPNTSAVAIIDAVTVRHTRPVAGPNPTAARATGVDATAEFRDYLLTHGICDLTHSVHPSHCMVSRGELFRLDAVGAFALRTRERTNSAESSGHAVHVAATHLPATAAMISDGSPDDGVAGCGTSPGDGRFGETYAVRKQCDRCRRRPIGWPSLG